MTITPRPSPDASSGGDRFSDPVGMSPNFPPIPPAIYEPTVRLVYSDFGLPELFAATATRNGMTAELLHPEEVASTIANVARSLDTRHISVAKSEMLDQIQIAQRLKTDGFDVREASGSEAGLLVTDCFAAVAETGSIVFRRSYPCFSKCGLIVVIEPRNLLADTIDLCNHQQDRPQDLLILSGPSSVRVLVLI